MAWRERELEWSGRIRGHGFISQYEMIEQFVETTSKLLNEDILEAQGRRRLLETETASIWTFTDFLYFSTITQSTVGYGDILPNETNVRSVVICQIVFAYAILIVGLNIILGSAPFTLEWFLNN
jgi:hypothetical protein